MKKVKKIWKSIPARVAYLVSFPIIILLLVVSLVTTQNKFLYETLKMVLGQERLNSQNMGYYKSDYEDSENPKQAAKDAALVFNEEAADEGIVLLKNDNSLPLNKSAKVTVFGKNSTDLVIGGSGSSASTATDLPTIYTALSDAGFNCNPTMKSFYEGSKSGSGRGENPNMSAGSIPGFATGETPLSSYSSEERNSYKEYNDAAIVIISRIGGEGFDLPRSMKTSFDGSDKVDGAGYANDHYLELDSNEKDMIQEACDNFNNVILVLNISSTFELGFLDTPVFTDVTGKSYDFSKVKSALFIGLTGETGINSLGHILSGEVSPSGHTADTYVRDFTKDPSWQNMSNNLITDGNRYTVGGKGQNAYYVEYEEGIYVGYRYYETRAASYSGAVTSLGEELYATGEDWYKANVVYPFGYGLSYTNFTWTLEDVKVNNEVKSGDIIFDKDTQFSVNVNVHNNGTVAGKDVVQLYVTAPYKNGGIEKSFVTLAAFEKTDLIPAGEDRKVTLKFSAYDFASYDYKTAKTYVLESGDYEFKLMKNSHEQVLSSIKGSLANDEKYTNDPTTGKPVTNRFDDVSDHIQKYLSRSDWSNTFPSVPTASDREVDQAFISSLRYRVNDQTTDPWYTDVMPTQASHELSSEEVTVKFKDLVKKENDTLSVDYDDTELWDSLLNQLTVEQMVTFVGTGNYQTAAIENIGKPKSLDPDGPSGYTIFASATGSGTATYIGEMLLACTWNVDLAQKMGVCIGNEGVIGDATDGTPYCGWYAPACNIHRSPFGGRNWEYYSEDGLLSGDFAASVVKGAKTKGVYCYVKHFALNEQEANRDNNGLIVWANEQSIREIYLKPFEAAVKDGKTTAMMSSFTRFGTTWAGGSYQLLTEILRNEWGFKGMVVTDYGVNKSYMNNDQMLRAGGDLRLLQGGYPEHMETATDVSVIRQATKNILYTTANSCLINMAEDFSYSAPIWVIVMIVVECSIDALLLAWCVTMTVLALRKKDESLQ